MISLGTWASTPQAAAAGHPGARHAGGSWEIQPNKMGIYKLGYISH